VISENELPGPAHGETAAHGGLPSPVLAVQRTAHHTVHVLIAALADLRLTPAELNVLANLADRGALSVSQLSAQTGTKASTLTSVLDRLEHRGYLTRELDAQDRRSFRLVLTAAGGTTADRIHGAVADLERRALAPLTASQIAGFHAVITALQEVS
jgi:MarR family transcriptional regulator, organic hydroperoxide resistance regulator